MKHPFWIINLGLLSLVLAAFAFIYFSNISITGPFKATSIEPEQIAPRREQKVAINIRKIYEDDLFGTYVKEVPHLKPFDKFDAFREMGIPCPPKKIGKSLFTFGI